MKARGGVVTPASDVLSKQKTMEMNGHANGFLFEVCTEANVDDIRAFVTSDASRLSDQQVNKSLYT